MKELQNYLRRATRGLWGEKRLEVWRELEGNLKLRIQELRLTGLPEAQATARALSELGDAQSLNAGLKGVHIMPKLTRGAAALVLTISLVVSNISVSQAQLTPVPWNEVVMGEKPSLIRLTDLQAELKRQGIASELHTGTMQSEGGKEKKVEGLSFYLVKDRAQWVQAVQQDSEKFVSFDDFVLSASQSGLPGEISGWENITFKIGQLNLSVGTSQSKLNPYYGYALLLARATSAFQNGFMWSFQRGGSNLGCVHRVQVSAQPGSIFGLVSRDLNLRDSPNNTIGRLIDVARVDSDGVVRFFHPQRTVDFVNDLKVLDSITNAFVPEKVVMVQLSNRVGERGIEYSIMLPKQAHSVSTSQSCL